MPKSVVAVIAVFAFVVTGAILGVVVLAAKRLSGPGKVKHVRCPSEEDSSPKRALIRGSEDEIKTSKT
jgi:hypothetical protein